MAEIKSTMEMVMERAARMEADSGDTELQFDDHVKDGMRTGAALMRGEEPDLAGALSKYQPEGRPHFMQGFALALLRNIVLPREEEQLQVAEQAMNGLLLAGEGNKELLAIFGDLKKILDQYGQHRKQLREQLEANFAQQMPQLEAAMAQKTGVPMKLKPSQHPKYQEEWQRVLGELDGQYGQAVDQHKELVTRILTSQV